MSIHKKRRKVEICHNCHTMLSLENNFCPQCGQENHDLKVPIGHLAFEVFEGFTHFDTKFYNTMKAIFTSPGKITKDFLEGRRGRYVPPVRLYFLISFVFFFGLGSAVDLAVERGGNFLTDLIDRTSFKPQNGKYSFYFSTKESRSNKNWRKSQGKGTVNKAEINQEKSKIEQKNITETEKITNTWLALSSNVDTDGILDEMNIQENDTLRKLISTLHSKKKRQRLIDIEKQIIADTINAEPITEINNQMRDYFTEFTSKKTPLVYSLNLHALKNNASVKINYDGDTLITVKASDGNLNNKGNLKKILTMNNSELDNLASKKGTSILSNPFLSRGFLKNLTYYQLAFKEDAKKASSELAHLFVNVFSVMMFILMPIVALLLKLIYSKSAHNIIFYPIRLIPFLWDWLLYTVGFSKVRKQKIIPHLLFGQTKFYYEHLIFSIHIHAVLFLFLTIFVGGGIALGFWKYALIVTFLAFIIYVVISLKTVYRQGILKTLFKSVILFALYSVSFFTVLIITSAIKFALS